MADDFRTVDSAAHAPEAVRRWAQKLTEAQGCTATLSREVSGYHLYLPCPECLHTHGRRELDDPKYAINLSILAGLGEHRDKSEGKAWYPGMFEDMEEIRKKKEFGAGVCMRTRSAKNPHIVSLEKLMTMGTVTERFPDIQTRSDIRGGSSVDDVTEYWEIDPTSGKLCPPPAGECVDLLSLPEGHAVIQYVLKRGYDVKKLVQQFRASYCIKEYPYGQKEIFYRKMPGGWRDCPQHRLVFLSLVGGVPLSWQARVIEKLSDDELNRYMLHPYAGGFCENNNADEILASHLRTCKTGGESDEHELVWDEARNGYWLHVWSHTDTRPNPKAPWQPIPPYDEMRDGSLKFKPSKYRTAKYSQRQLMGWDAAVARAAADDTEFSWCVLVEGPLDAARIGPGGMAVTGSSISPENAARVLGKFNVVLLAFDDDIAGRNATTKIDAALNSTKHGNSVLITTAKLPLPPGKDPGDLRQSEYEELFNHTWRRIRRTF